MHLLSLLLAATVASQGPSAVLDSLDRSAALKLAREGSPRVEAEEAAVRTADAELAAARAERGLHLPADFFYLRCEIPSDVASGAPTGFAPLLDDNLALGLRVGQAVYTGERTGAAVRAAEAGRDAATNRARAARDARRPSVGLELGVLTTRPELVTGPSSWGEELYAAIGLTWTLFDFGRSSSRASAFVADADRVHAVESGLEVLRYPLEEAEGGKP